MVSGDGLPNQICLNCVQELNRICKFKQLCEKSDLILRNRMKFDIPLYDHKESNQNEPCDEGTPPAFGDNGRMNESKCETPMVQWEDEVITISRSHVIRTISFADKGCRISSHE